MIDTSTENRNHRYTEAFKKYYEGPEKKDLLSLKGKGEDSLSSWFLGPKAENANLLRSLIIEAMDYHFEYRLNFHPEDPPFITKETMETASYKTGVDELRNHTKNLLIELKQSVPFFTNRYLGHMNWETTLPGLVGYFAAMLYNPNNVAVESSPVTTKLEMEVGNDLCRMLGYGVPNRTSLSPNETREITPWGHITCDGTVANLEALWASRNLKFFPIALKNAILNEGALTKANDIEIKLLNGKKDRLVTLDNWTLLNLEADEVLSLPQIMQQIFNIPTSTLTQALQNYSLQNLGLVDFYNRYLKDEIKYNAVILAPTTRHYSWPKAAAILGIGANSVLNVPIDIDARMDLEEFRKILQQCLDKRQPVISVVSVLGSTEENAVDPLKSILEIRKEFRNKGLDFVINADAAWGGYFASLLREDDGTEYEPTRTVLAHFIPSFPLNSYVIEQYHALRYADSITIDPHKAGFIPYPAGGLCYKNSAMRNLVSFTAPVVYHNDVDPTVGIYGVEGSKPGAAATATYLSHKVIRPTKNGYGRILGECIFTSKKLYSQLISMKDDRFIVIPFHRLPAEKSMESKEKICEQIEFIRKRIVGRTNAEIVQDKEAMDLLREIGSDQALIPYIFNFKDKTGKLNTDIAKMNELNATIFKILSMVPGDLADSKSLIVTSSEFKQDIYGNKFMNALRERLGIKGGDNTSITFIISTVMNPWITDLQSDDSQPKPFLDVIENILRSTVYRALEAIGI
jgi:glutamate/tyrosine decarboxylase-like PLP-dependent enzyme